MLTVTFTVLVVISVGVNGAPLVHVARPRGLKCAYKMSYNKLIILTVSY